MQTAEDRFAPPGFEHVLLAPAKAEAPLSLERILAEGSKSFHAASKLLPRRIRKPVTVLYAYCRIADDAVDRATDPKAALSMLHRRLDNLYEGHPADHPLDRAFFETVTEYQIPKSIVAAMLEGFQWDNEGRQYDTIEDTMDYCARVASTVGVMMTLIMGERSPEVLARACDLGLAMQLVNICRDVGEDADMGRIYLPTDRLAEAGIDRHAFLAHPVFTPALGRVVRRTLETAKTRFALADVGIAALPKDARLAIRAASLIYADIGRVIRKNDFDSVSTRAHTSKLRKLWLSLRAMGAQFWRPKANVEPPHPSVQFLVDAVVRHDASRAKGALPA